MNSIRRILSLSLTDPEQQDQASEIACYITAVLVLVCGSITVGLLGEDLVDTILAMLGVFCLSAIFVVMGQIFDLRRMLRETTNR
jgi:hypothetical protein